MTSQFIFDAIGTRWAIDISSTITREQENELLLKIQNRIAMFDKTYSRFRNDSLVSEVSRKVGVYQLPDDALLMFSIYRNMYDITRGLMTPLIGQVLVDAGYDATYSLTQKKELVAPVSWDEAFTYKHPYIDIKIPTLLDFGAAGKGYLIDIVGQLIEDSGVTSYCIDAGGDILQRSKESLPLSIGLEHPDDSEKVVGVVPLLNRSLCGSAGNRRAWGNFHHIINPDTLTSPRHIKALWVIADSTLVADALSTALFFVAPEKLIEHFDFEYCIMFADNSYKKSFGFIGEMYEH